MVQTTEKKLLNSIVDQLAKENPEFLYAEIPLSPSSLELGFRQVTYRVFANAINGMAWWLDRTLGRGGNFETLSYLGPNDLLYNIILLGAVKAGYKVGMGIYIVVYYQLPAKVRGLPDAVSFTPS